MKFKVGDKVKVRDDSRAWPEYTGKEAVVTKVLKGFPYPYSVHIEGPRYPVWLHANELERI